MTRPTTTRRALGGAAAAMMLMVAPAAVSANAAELDGELLAACARFVWLDAEFCRLVNITGAYTTRSQTPEIRALLAQQNAISDEEYDLGEWIAAAVPKTPEGLQAKARITLVHLRGEIDDDMDARLQFSILQHLAGNAEAEGNPRHVPAVVAHPDAELVRTCAQHAINMDAYNTGAGSDFDDSDPLWIAYSETRDAISAAEPKTLAGVLAVARAAVAESDGKEPEHCGLDAQWAWAAVSSLLRMHGEA